MLFVAKLQDASICARKREQLAIGIVVAAKQDSRSSVEDRSIRPRAPMRLQSIRLLNMDHYLRHDCLFGANTRGSLAVGVTLTVTQELRRLEDDS